MNYGNLCGDSLLVSQEIKNRILWAHTPGALDSTTEVFEHSDLQSQGCGNSLDIH